MLGVDYHVIQVYCGIKLVKPQQDVHHALERGRSPVQPKGKGPVLPVSTGGAESRLGFGSFREGHLPVPFWEVKCGDVPDPTEAIQELIHPRHWVAVKLRDFVEAVEVIAAVEGAIWFWYNDDRAGPRAVKMVQITPHFSICWISSSIARRRASGTL